MSESAVRDLVWHELDRSLKSTDSVQEYLQSVVQRTADVLGVEGSYSISLILHDHPWTVATTERFAWEADQVEFDTAEGPCVEAMRTGALTTDVDLSSETRWPAWAAVASLLGFRSAAGIPAAVAPDSWLALNLYSTETDAFGVDVIGRGQQFLTEIARTLPVALRLAEQNRLLTQLQEALASRATIDQALGVLMGQNRCTRDEAFGILRRASQNRNVKLRDVAAAVISRFTGHEAATLPAFRTGQQDPNASAAIRS